MFTTDPTIVDLKIKERNLYKAIFSMNFHQVATPELGVAEARFYIFFFREGDKLSAYIVLYMPSSGRKLYYSYASNPFPEVDLPMVEDVARAFGEEMGFFLDEKSFASSSVGEKNLWINEQPLFGENTPEDAVGSTETTALPAEQTPLQAAVPDEVASTAPEAPEAPAIQPVSAAPVYQQAPAPPVPPAPPAAPAYYQPAPTVPPPPAAPGYYQPAPVTPAAQPAPVAPVFQQAPAPPVPPAPPAAPAYYQPAPPAQPTPAAPGHYQPAPPAPPPAAPVYYQPAPPAPAAPQTPVQPMHQKEIEIEPQIEVEVEVDARPSRQKSSAVPRPSTEKMKAAGTAPRTARPVRPNPLEEEHRAAQKNPPPAPKQQAKKESRAVVGVVNREMEALARLLASF